MKKILILALGLLPAFAAGQTYVTAQGGALTSGYGNKSLFTVNAPVTFADISGTISPAVGSVSLQTPVLSSGALADNATFGAGGSFIVQISSPSAITYNGVFQSGAAWTKQTLANGTHSYTLAGSLTDVVTGETATFVLQTQNIGTGNFDTVVGISYISIALN
jgi:hypothetical protein